jgi:predicted MPP superfamily phosphohydrolase
MPFRPLVVLTVLLHVYIGIRLLPTIDGVSHVASLAVLVALLTSAATMPLPFLAFRGHGHSIGRSWQWTGLVAMGWFSSMFVATLLRDVALLVAWAAQGAGFLASEAVSRLSFWSAIAVPLVATASSLIGFLNARRTARVVRVDVPIAGLPSALQGFTIAQLSDLHVGPTIRHGYIQRIVDRVNRLEADAVAITGDLVDGNVSTLQPHIAPLTGLKARHGTFVVTGNHEYYAGATAWVAELRRMGLRVLQNEHVLLAACGPRGGMAVRSAQTDDEADAATLLLAGVNDFTAGHFDAAQASDPQGALAGAPPGVATRILLAHQPRSATAASAAGFQLQLSGHTHGGQFFPWNFFVPLQQPYVAGLHRRDGMWIYVSRGTGYWGPPKRIGAPSEITLVRLVAA